MAKAEAKDRISDERIDLVKKIARYSPERGATFAGYRVRGAILDALPLLCFPRAHDDADLGGLISDEPDVEERTVAHEAQRRVRQAVANLPARERTFIDNVYFGDKPMARAGAELGISRSWASRIHGRAVRRLRAPCEKLRDLTASIPTPCRSVDGLSYRRCGVSC